MIIAVKRAVKGVHEKVINYLKHKNSPMFMIKPLYKCHFHVAVCLFCNQCFVLFFSFVLDIPRL